MIKIDALYYLVFIELMIVVICASIYFIVRWRKYASLYYSSMKDLEAALLEKDKLQKKLAEIRSKAPQQAKGTGDGSVVAQAASAKSQENDKIELTILEDKLKEKNKLLNDMQVKFDALEKEYFILYHQQKKQDADPSA
jgi:Tfp pilus assembly protein PilE